MTSLISDAVYYGVIYYDITNHIYHHFATSSLPFTMASFTMISLITSTPSLRYLLSTMILLPLYQARDGLRITHGATHPILKSVTRLIDETQMELELRVRRN